MRAHLIVLRSNTCQGSSRPCYCFAFLRSRQVPEIRGHVPELETPLEDFRAEVLNCYDATLARVAGIHQVILCWACLLSSTPAEPNKTLPSTSTTFLTRRYP